MAVRHITLLQGGHTHMGVPVETVPGASLVP